MYSQCQSLSCKEFGKTWSSQCFARIPHVCGNCVEYSDAQMFHRCVCAESERLTYIIQGKIKREREREMAVPVGNSGTVYVCACWVGRWLPGYKARLWWYMCVEGHGSLSLRKTKKVLFTTCCKEGARRWKINKETARQNNKLKRNMNSLSACFHLAFLLLVVCPSIRLSEISIIRWIFGTLKHPSNTRHTHKHPCDHMWVWMQTHKVCVRNLTAWIWAPHCQLICQVCETKERTEGVDRTTKGGVWERGEKERDQMLDWQHRASHYLQWQQLKITWHKSSPATGGDQESESKNRETATEERVNQG